jgi:protein tyrosine phosphatase
LTDVIDLTYTDKYYKNSEWQRFNVSHFKFKTGGRRRGVMDQQHLALIIFQIIKQRDRAEKSGKKCVIGVHCTHGINRTGYVIAAFLRVNFDTIKMEDAI